MDFQIKNILVPTDFSNSANIALCVAIDMAKRHNACLHLINVVQPMVLGKFVTVRGSISNVQNKILIMALENMRKHETVIISETILSVKTTVEVGNLDLIVQKYEEDNYIDLTVIGTHGVTGYDENFVGSNAISIIKKSNCPVLSIPPTFIKTSFERILFPIRYVEGIEEKYDFIKPIIEKNNSIVHLQGLFEPMNNEEIYPITNELQRIKNKINNNGYLVSYQVNSTDNIEELIIDTAEVTQSDLIIINATLDKKWYHFSGKTFTDQIVSKSKIPVLSIKPNITEDSVQSALKIFFQKQNNTFHYK